MEWELANFLACTLAIGLGALLQAVTGLGAGLVVVPLLALVSFKLVPGPVIFASLTLSSLMAFRGRENIDYTNTGTLSAGLVAGTIVAAFFIARLPLASLGLVFGTLVLAAVAISARTTQLHLQRGGLLGVGALSGFMGASAGIGAPVLALLYQHRAGPEIRATLAYLYVISSLIMLFCLHLAGRFGQVEAFAGVFLMPGFLLGYVLAPRLARFVDGGYARIVVLVISTVSALSLIIQSTLRLAADVS